MGQGQATGPGLKVITIIASIAGIAAVVGIAFAVQRAHQASHYNYWYQQGYKAAQQMTAAGNATDCNNEWGAFSAIGVSNGVPIPGNGFYQGFMAYCMS